MSVKCRRQSLANPRVWTVEEGVGKIELPSNSRKKTLIPTIDLDLSTRNFGTVDQTGIDGQIVLALRKRRYGGRDRLGAVGRSEGNDEERTWGVEMQDDPGIEALRDIYPQTDLLTMTCRQWPWHVCHHTDPCDRWLSTVDSKHSMNEIVYYVIVLSTSDCPGSPPPSFFPSSLGVVNNYIA